MIQGNSLKVLLLMALLFAGPLLVRAQSSSGILTGTISNEDGGPLANVVVTATNQTTSDKETSKTNSSGRYRFRLKAGAYRLNVQPPYEARFERADAPAYGVFANVICDKSRKQCPQLENILIGEGEKKIDFVAVPLEIETAADPEQDEPTGTAGPDSVESAPQTSPYAREVRDRWRIGFPEYDRYGDKGAKGRDIPFRRNTWANPYDQSVLKGDYPIIGNEVFMVLSGTSTSSFEMRRTPSGNNVSSNAPNSNNFFGRPESLSVINTVQLSFELFKGDTAFKPRSWAIKISPTFSVPNYLNARENGIVNIDVRRGTNRVDLHTSLEEAFAEVKLFDTNRNYDFVSVRAGIQPFVSDFRGFVYSDNNLGVRVFGSFSNNKSQFNVAYFRQLEKDTNSNLNSLHDRPRHQNVYIANFYRQDFLYKGYTIQASALFNDDRASTHYDANGFLVRPALVGSVRPHNVKACYIGINGDGHIGRLNLSHAFYYVFGTDDFQPIAGRKTNIRAKMAAIEASVDVNWLRYRASLFYASGDKNPTDDKAGGFDAIFDDPNFVGGQFSYWNRQGIRLVSTDIGLVQPNSLLPTLRTSKTEGQANFVNPGIWILNAGIDVEVTQTLKTVFNANYMRFDRTESLEYVLFQPGVRKEIGLDLNMGVIYRPFLINNVTFSFGGAVFKAGRGFRDVYRDASRNCPVPNFCQPPLDIPNPSKLQYSLFAQMKLIY